MARETSYTAARASLAALCDEVAEGGEPVYITRRGAATVALVSAEELRGLLETAHLLRSPRNAERLIAALAGARRGRGRRYDPTRLQRELGLAPTK